jgi:hypothetical protein
VRSCPRSCVLAQLSRFCTLTMITFTDQLLASNSEFKPHPLILCMGVRTCCPWHYVSAHKKALTQITSVRSCTVTLDYSDPPTHPPNHHTTIQEGTKSHLLRRSIRCLCAFSFLRYLSMCLDLVPKGSLASNTYTIVIASHHAPHNLYLMDTYLNHNIRGVYHLSNKQ